jgi:hypothetical protein
MEGWSDFYTLIGSTAATLIGLIFVVISLGADHAKKGDEHRLRVGVTPTLVHFASLLFSALAMMAPLSDMARALAVGLIGCAGLGYMVKLAFLVPKGIKAEERQPIWFGILPLVAYIGFLMTAAAWALASEFSARDWRPCLRGAARCGASQLLDHDANHPQPAQLTK